MDTDQIDTSLGSILIVDDSADNLRVLSATLRQQGYQIRCAKSGSMALLGVQAFPPDLILLDILMPEMDGYEVCHRLKANPQTCDIPVIFLSALDETNDKVKAFQAGGADYITKPFQGEEVLARVEHQLTIRRLRQQLTEQSLQLKQAKEVAEAADQVKITISRISNELQAPLNTILDYSQLLSQISPDQKYQEKLQVINRNGEHLLALINEVLTATQIETGS